MHPLPPDMSPEIHPGASPAREAWSTVALALMPAAFLMQFDKHVMAVLAPTIQKEFGLTLIEITRVLAAMAWSYSLFQVPGAWVASRLGPLRTIGLCVFGWSLAVFLTPLAIGALGLLLFRTLMGAFQAPDFVSSIMVLQREIPLRLRSRGSAALLGGAYLGTILSGPVAVNIAEHYGWRTCFHAVGAAGMVFGPAVVLYSFVERMRRPRGGLRNAWVGLSFMQTVRQPRVHALAASYMLFLAVQSFVYTMLPLYLSGAWHTSLVATGWLSSAPFVALYLSVVGGGVLSDTVANKTGSLFLARVCIGGASMVGSGACFAFGMSMDTVTGMLAVTCAGMAFVGFGQVILWSAVQDASVGAGGFVTAWVQLLGGLGTGFGPVVAAYLVTPEGDWSAVRFLLIACGIGAAICLWLARPHRPLVDGGATEIDGDNSSYATETALTR